MKYISQFSYQIALKRVGLQFCPLGRVVILLQCRQLTWGETVVPQVVISKKTSSAAVVTLYDVSVSDLRKSKRVEVSE
jgi:hypothetical protein